MKIEGVSDPCTEAALFWGDQALSEDDVQESLLKLGRSAYVLGFQINVD